MRCWPASETRIVTSAVWVTVVRANANVFLFNLIKVAGLGEPGQPSFERMLIKRMPLPQTNAAPQIAIAESVQDR